MKSTKKSDASTIYYFEEIAEKLLEFLHPFRDLDPKPLQNPKSHYNNELVIKIHFRTNTYMR